MSANGQKAVDLEKMTATDVGTFFTDAYAAERRPVEITLDVEHDELGIAWTDADSAHEVWVPADRVRTLLLKVPFKRP